MSDDGLEDRLELIRLRAEVKTARETLLKATGHEDPGAPLTYLAGYAAGMIGAIRRQGSAAGEPDQR